MASQTSESDRRAWTAAVWLLLGVTALRLCALFASPIELYPDEAQYWVWSRDLAWGYFSKPPMVAWLIRLTTAIGGQEEAWVRISSVLLHGAAPLFLFAAARRLYDSRTALLATAIYSLMPGVQLSAGVASTDAPLMFFLSAGLWAYVRLLRSPATRWASPLWGAALGLFLGLAFLSKYAAGYCLAGLFVHALVSDEARRAWRPRVLLAAGAGLTLMLAPNFGWNAHNRFVTFAHTAANADWTATSFFHLREAVEFTLSQIGVFGPVPFAALTLGLALAVRRRGLRGADLPADVLLLCLTLPAIVAVAIQALLSRANANWAFSAYVPGAVLAAAWLTRWRARRWAGAGLGLQAALALIFLIGAASPPVAERLGLANSLKRARGWAAVAQAVLDRADAEPGLSAIAADERFVFNELSYYGRDRLAAPRAPPLRMWVREAAPLSHAELTAPLLPAEGRRVLAVSRTPETRQEFVRDFAGVSGGQSLRIRLDPRRTRDLVLFIGSGFEPRPRDPLTRLPIP